MKRFAAALVLLAGFVCGAVSTAHAATGTRLVVFAAASLTDAFGELGARFEKTHPGVRVVFDFAGSQQLAARLSQGARADVFASADGRAMDAARKAGRVSEDPEIFARNVLAVITPHTNPGRIASLGDLGRPGQKVVICSDAVPAGHYAREVLRKLATGGAVSGIGADYATRVMANVVSEEENVRSVVSKVVLGEADAGLCYRSDVTRATARHVRVIDVPDAANVIAEYPIARVSDSAHADLAAAFLALVNSNEGQSVLRAAGFRAR